MYFTTDSHVSISVLEWNLTNTVSLGKSDLNEEVTLLQGDNLHCRKQFGTEHEWM